MQGWASFIINSQKRMWIVIIIIEVIYILVARTIAYFFGIFNFEAEAYRSANRIVMFAITLIIFRDFIFRNNLNYKNIANPLLLLAILFFLSIPLLEGHMDELGLDFRIFFAATSLFVAMHEEIVYRGIIQGLLLERFSMAKALLLTSSIFTAYHIGAIDFYINLYIQIFLASIILGIIYIKTNSLLLVVAIHALYDALSPFAPMYNQRPIVTYQEATCIMFLATALVLVWFYKTRTS